ncbi:MAG TPA: hypothetical protein PLB05_04505 [Candidatus Omnitrophota bacterium]|nr:hypothetical protein [Candidatus Omnitrophota bacterium]
MIVIFNICVGLFVVSFWAAILSFIPTFFYLFVLNPLIVRFETTHRKGIFDIHEETLYEQRKKSRGKVVLMIYGVCLLIGAAVFLLNWRQYQQPGINPFDILSALSVILFWSSVLTYLPFRYYLTRRPPGWYKEEGVCLPGMFVTCGAAMLLFSLLFTHHWFKIRAVPVQFQDMISGTLLLILPAAVVSYFSVWVYIFYKFSRLSKDHTVRSSVIFVIYSICFVLLAGLFSSARVLAHLKKGEGAPAGVSRKLTDARNL